MIENTTTVITIYTKVYMYSTMVVPHFIKSSNIQITHIDYLDVKGFPKEMKIKNLQSFLKNYQYISPQHWPQIVIDKYGVSIEDEVIETLISEIEHDDEQIQLLNKQLLKKYLNENLTTIHFSNNNLVQNDWLVIKVTGEKAKKYIYWLAIFKEYVDETKLNIEVIWTKRVYPNNEHIYSVTNEKSIIPVNSIVMSCLCITESLYGKKKKKKIGWYCHLSQLNFEYYDNSGTMMFDRVVSTSINRNIRSHTSMIHSVSITDEEYQDAVNIIS